MILATPIAASAVVYCTTRTIGFFFQRPERFHEPVNAIDRLRTQLADWKEAAEINWGDAFERWGSHRGVAALFWQWGADMIQYSWITTFFWALLGVALGPVNVADWVWLGIGFASLITPLLTLAASYLLRPLSVDAADSFFQWARIADENHRIEQLPRSQFNDPMRVSYLILATELADPERNAPEATPDEAIDPFGLVALPRIPEALANDPVLREYICPIRRRPIRSIAGDPNGITLYERSAILERIDRWGTSPVTGLPLTGAQLIERPDLQARIDNRLRFFEERIREATREFEDDN